MTEGSLGSLGDMIDVDASSETPVQAVAFTVMTEDDFAFLFFFFDDTSGVSEFLERR